LVYLRPRRKVLEAISNGNIPPEEGLTYSLLVYRGKVRVSRALDSMIDQLKTLEVYGSEPKKPARK
jgi:hypothetical protein